MQPFAARKPDTTRQVGNHRFVFVGGHHRSGTSLLHACIRDHPQVSGFQKTGALEDEGQFLQSVYPTDDELGTANGYGFEEGGHLDETSPLATAPAAETLFREWSEHWDLRKPVLVEKTPSNLMRTRFLQELFPEAYFVIIRRHPVAACFATHKWHGESVDRMIEHWLFCYETFARDASHLQHVHTLRYEDFVERPEEELQKIYSFLGLRQAPLRQTVKTGMNEKYFEMWRKRPLWNRRLTSRFNYAPLRETTRMYHRLRFERRVRRFGYSLWNLEKH